MDIRIDILKLLLDAKHRARNTGQLLPDASKGYKRFSEDL